MTTEEGALKLAVRGSDGIYIISGDGRKKENISVSSNCRVMDFSLDGSLFAWCDGTSVSVMDCSANEKLFEMALPRTRCLTFSPRGTYLITWEPYIVSKDIPAGQCNLHIWDMHGQIVSEFIQKQQDNWCPRWTDDEFLCCRNVTNEVHCFDKGVPSRSIDQKLQVAGLAQFSLAPGGKPYKIAAYIPGSKGAPAFVRMYLYPHLSSVVASRSFYKADTVNLIWNSKGNALLVVTATDVDKSGASYYGEQGLYYLSSKGDGNIIPLKKKGPIYAVEWSPNSEEFCVCYGWETSEAVKVSLKENFFTKHKYSETHLYIMPANVTLFNQSCEKIYDFGSGHRNTIGFNAHGNILAMAGFGNLRGNMFHFMGLSIDVKDGRGLSNEINHQLQPKKTKEFWNRKELKNFSNFQASDSTSFEWGKDGIHFVTATTAPRLREGNGYKIWHVTKGIVYTTDIPKPHELWEVKWRPHKLPFPEVDISTLEVTALSRTPNKEKPAAYVPPALRGKPQSTRTKLHEFEPPENVSKENSSEPVSKSAMKNKRKKDAKHKASLESSQSQSRERQDVLATAAYVTKPSIATSSSSTSTDSEKQLKSLKKFASLKSLCKCGRMDRDENCVRSRNTTTEEASIDALPSKNQKLHQIEQLKQKQSNGEKLEVNQIEKINNEGAILEAIKALDITST